MEVRKIYDYLWEIPKQGAMLVPGRIYANGRMMDELRDDPAFQQVANVACLPGIVGYSQWFREFEHTGDLGIEVTAPSRTELFRRTAIAMAGVMVDTAGVVKRQSREIVVAGVSNTDLMHDVLSKLLEIFIIDSFIWSEVAVEEKPQGLKLRLWGETYDPSRHEFRTEIKAITYHELAVTRQKNGDWRTREPESFSTSELSWMVKRRNHTRSMKLQVLPDKRY